MIDKKINGYIMFFLHNGTSKLCPDQFAQAALEITKKYIIAFTGKQLQYIIIILL